MYIDKIPSDAIQIKNSYDYIDPKGNVYGIEKRKNKYTGKPFIKSQHTVYGYKYCGINYRNGRHISKRVHRLVAEAFIPNPNSYPIVMHRDNNKKNNVVDNLKWGTVSENTQQAVDDGLLVNKKGFEDDQSTPCTCYETLTNKLVGHFGSISIASKEMNISKRGITYQLNNPSVPIRKKFYFVPYKQNPKEHYIIGQFDYETDIEINRFVNIMQACNTTNIPTNTIKSQITKESKPKLATKNGFYFKKIIVK